MKKLILAFIVLFNVSLQAQTIPFNYSIRLKPVTIDNFPGLHSYVFAQANGKWLIMGGRKDGIHARQPFAAFPAASSNSEIYVIDIQTKQFWSSSLSSLSVSIQEQLQSTNMNFYQDEDTLYVIGGYGYSNTAQDHITYPNLCSINVNGLINAVMNSNPIGTYFKQITDQNFAVNGGHLGKIGASFYLIGGHRFDGRYNPMSNPTYTQIYVDGIKKFNLNNSGSLLSYSNYSLITDQVHLHRRDYNLMPQIFPNGEEGYTISSGVFQVSVNLPFLYPVDVKASGHTAITTFNQYLSNYHSANLALYDSIQNTMHSIFFGGMSQYTYVNGILTQDVNVPFVKTISRVSRDANGNLQEVAFANEMPALLGASSEFIPNNLLAHYSNEVIKLSKLSGDSILVGHIVGGLLSSQTNPFTNNTTSSTSANTTIYEVWLVNDNRTGIRALNGENPMKVSVFPNPSKKDIHLNIQIPYSCSVDLLITNIEGKIVKTEELGKINVGETSIALENSLSAGTYFFNFVFDGKYSRIEKVLIRD